MQYLNRLQHAYEIGLIKSDNRLMNSAELKSLLQKKHAKEQLNLLAHAQAIQVNRLSLKTTTITDTEKAYNDSI